MFLSLQYPLHVVTVVGIEYLAGGQVAMLVLDPAVTEDFMGQAEPIHVANMMRREMGDLTHDRYAIVKVGPLVTSQQAYEAGKVFVQHVIV